MKTAVIGAFVLLITVSGSQTCAKTSPRASKNVAATPTPTLEEQRLALERDRFSFEKEKFDDEKRRENEKLAQESTKMWLTAGSLVLPLLAALGTLLYSIISFRSQLRQTAHLQSESAKLQFEIKAAEIAFAGKTPGAVRNRAEVLKAIFDKRLPDSFPPPFDAEKHGGDKEPSDEKLIFFKTLAEHYDKAPELIALWDTLFTGDRKWLDRVKSLIPKPGKGDSTPDDDA